MTFLLLIVLLSCSTLSAKFNQAKHIALHPNAKQIVDKAFPGWRLYETTGLDKIRRPVHPIAGDFNGDGNTDFAALIVLPDSSEPRARLIVCLSDSINFKLFRLSNFLEYDHPSYIDLVPKGTTAYDEDSFEPLVLERDAVGFGYEEKSGMVFYFNKGRFVTFASSGGC